MQGAVSGVALALGYGFGAGGSALWHYLQIPTLRGRVRRVVLAVLVLAVALAQWRFVGWQNDQRRLFGMEPISPAEWPVLALVTLLVATLLLVVARALRLRFRTMIRWFRRMLPERLANVLGVTLALLLVWGLVSGVLVRGFWAGANAMFAPQDLINKSGVEHAPTSALRTGGPGSTVTWDSLGREGRADVVLRELQRTGAFSRKVLVLTTTTGSGFIQPGGVDPVEYLWHGDTAVAGVQYSYLPSWLSLLADQQNVQQASQSVFQTVYRYWSTLPEGTRPRLYLYGLSLGSFGVQSVLTNIELLNQPISGALMVGPPFVNTLHQQLTAQREPTSPVWRPVYEGGETVRFTAQEPVLETNPQGPSGLARAARSDPVVWSRPLSCPGVVAARRTGAGRVAEVGVVPPGHRLPGAARPRRRRGSELGLRAPVPAQRKPPWVGRGEPGTGVVERPAGGTCQAARRDEPGEVGRGPPKAAVASSHDRLRAGQRAVLAGVTGVGTPPALLVTARLRVTNPAAVGRKLADRLQDLLAGASPGHRADGCRPSGRPA